MSKPEEGARGHKFDARALVIDDDPGVLAFCHQALQPILAEVEAASGAAAGLACLSRKPFDIVVTDLQMPGVDGYAVIEEIHSRWADTEIVVMTAYPGEDVVERLLEMGISSMLVKPISIPQLFYTIMGARKMLALRRENEKLRVAMEEQPFGIVGNSPEIRNVIKQMGQVGPLELSVLIAGESGTGKELVARGIHACSRRSKGPFVAVNCAAVSRNLIESELFGHAKGAFTDARSDKLGLIEAANNGTLFLDEIGEMPLDLQPKLLRVLDSGEMLRVGETKPRYADVRVIAATNRSLQQLVESKAFRDDLFFRIRGFQIDLPPLRERGGDVVVLAEHLLGRYCPPGRNPLKLVPNARQMLMGHSWPGNVRELQNAAAALYATTQEDFVKAHDVARLLGVERDEAAAEGLLEYKDFKRIELAKLERQYFANLLTTFQGNVTKAAEAAGMYRGNLRDKLQRCELKPSDYKTRKKSPS